MSVIDILLPNDNHTRHVRLHRKDLGATKQRRNQVNVRHVNATLAGINNWNVKSIGDLCSCEAVIGAI